MDLSTVCKAECAHWHWSIPLTVLFLLFSFVLHRTWFLSDGPQPGDEANKMQADRGTVRVMVSASRQEDGRIRGENKSAMEEVCLVTRFPPEALYGGRVGVKEAEAGWGKWSLERKGVGGRKEDRHCDAEGQRGESHVWVATKETAVKAAPLSSSDAFSPPGRKVRENSQGHAQLITNAGHRRWSALCSTITWCKWNTWQGDKLHSFGIIYKSIQIWMSAKFRRLPGLGFQFQPTFISWNKKKTKHACLDESPSKEIEICGLPVHSSVA